MIHTHLNHSFFRICKKHVKIFWNIQRNVRLKPRIIERSPAYYLNIEQKLNQINYYENPLNLVDIGIGKDEKIAKNISSLINNLGKGNEEYDDDDEVKEINYNKIKRIWSLSESGRREIVDLANHYAIFRDLFPSPQLPTCKNPLEPTSATTFFFSNYVHINCEFCITNSQIELGEEFFINEEKGAQKDDEIISMPIYRGNIVMPKYCVNAPNVFIDASAINGIDTYSHDDGNFVDDNLQSIYDEKQFGGVKLLGDNEKFFTLALLNLDSVLGSGSPTCHWLVGNIHNDMNNITKYENVIDYLPVYGVKGFGYHRYVFLLLQYESPIQFDKISDFDISKRHFNPYDFIKDHQDKVNIKPVGMSWFQSKWDFSCQKVFWEKLNMRSPVYECIMPSLPKKKQQQFPHGAPFNIYLDGFRDPKEIAKSALLERLSTVNPLNYKDEFKPSLTPPNIYKMPLNTPDWLKASIRRKRYKIGSFRALRPHSVVQQLDNNADLDKPMFPLKTFKESPLNLPLHYPDGVRRRKALRFTKWVKPPNEHPTYRIEHENSASKDDLKKIKLE